MSIIMEDKLGLVLASFRAKVSMADLCREDQVPESTFRDWRDRFITAGWASFEDRPAKRDPWVDTLTRENDRLKTVVADFAVENLVLKKGRNGTLSRGTL